MQVAVRPRFAAGVALVGAGVIAASTVSPVPDIHLPDLRLPSIQTASVQLAALANPLEVYAQVFQSAIANVNTLAENSLPGQVLQQLIANQVSSATVLAEALGVTGGKVVNAVTTQIPQLLQTALTELGAGNVEGANNALLQIPLALALPALDLLPALTTVLSKPLENLVNVMKAFTADPLGTQLLISGLIAPLISTPAAAGAAFQNVLNAVVAGDPTAVVNAIVTAPATIVDGFLNGGYGPDLAPLVGVSGIIVKAGGLLSSTDLTFGPDGSITIGTGGPLAALQQVLQKIATAITPPKPPAVQSARTDIAGIPAVDTKTVSLALAPASAPSKTTPSAEPTTGSGTTETSGQTPASTPAETSAATPQDESATAPVSTPDESTGDTESEAPAKDSTPSTPKDEATGVSDVKQSTDSAVDKTPTGKDTDVKTGNKVEPKTTAGKHSTKSGDAAASHETAAESGSSTGTTSETGASKDASKASSS